MPRPARVCLERGGFVPVDLDQAQAYPTDRLGAALPNGDLVYNSWAFQVLEDLQRRLTGARTADLLFAGATVNTGALFHDQASDLWFIEVSTAPFMTTNVRYAELTREEAWTWLDAHSYEIPGLSPSPWRYRFLVEASTEFVNYCKESVDYQRRTPPNDWPIVWRMLHRKAARLNEALGGRFGVSAVRRAEGWDESVALEVGRISRAFEKIVEREVDAWGLRCSTDPSNLADLPDSGKGNAAFFGDTRFRPFTFGPRIMESLKALEEASISLARACNARFAFLSTVPNTTKSANKSTSRSEPHAEAASKLLRSLHELLRLVEFHESREPEECLMGEEVMIWGVLDSVKSDLRSWTSQLKHPTPSEVAGLSRLRTILDEAPPEEERFHPGKHPYIVRLSSHERVRSLRATYEILSNSASEMGARSSTPIIENAVAPGSGPGGLPDLQSNPDAIGKETRTSETKAPPCPVVLLGQDEEPLVYGKPKPILTIGQYKLISTFIAAYPDRISLDSLSHRSGVESPARMMDRLCKDKDWKAVLIKPGKSYGGYGLRAKRPGKDRRSQ